VQKVPVLEKNQRGQIDPHSQAKAEPRPCPDIQTKEVTRQNGKSEEKEVEPTTPAIQQQTDSEQEKRTGGSRQLEIAEPGEGKE
jgi:hypothetical protein